MEKNKEEISKEEERNNVFDKIFKENIAMSFLPLMKEYFGFEPEWENLKEITESLQTTLERKPDFLRIHETEGKKYIIHLEIQTKNDAKMHLRMLEYMAMLVRKYEVPVYQLVLFVGDEKMNMKPRVEFHNVFFWYEIISLKEKHYSVFLENEDPEFAILAILADFGKEKPEDVIKKIIERIVTISQENPRFKNTNVRDKYITQLSTLSKINDLQPIILSTLRNMALTFDVKKDAFYLEGFEDALEKPIKKVYKQGMNLQEIADLFEVTIDFVKKILEIN